MATKSKTPAGTQRDVSRALKIAKALLLWVEPDIAADAQELVEILTRLDARTGRRDPSTRKKVTK